MHRPSHTLKHAAGTGSIGRILVTILFVLSLLWTQIFQFAHEFSHLKQGFTNDEAVCVTCVALKVLDGSNLIAVVGATLAPVSHTPTTFLVLAAPANTTLRPYQSRAPPTFSA